jgi:anti-sigma B factor antagonist
MNEIRDSLFETKVDRLENITVVRAFGEIDAATAPALAVALQEATEPSLHLLVVDLTMVTLLDSSGLGVLIAYLNQLKAWRDETEVGMGPTEMRLVVSERILKVLSVTGLDAVFSIVPTMEAAFKLPG